MGDWGVSESVFLCITAIAVAGVLYAIVVNLKELGSRGRIDRRDDDSDDHFC
ncbi:hypothetical protein Corgl_0730 [Coriobacterium glomerans PW2]|uniref:Uncharacterized protein n=1 Tax=Coriobacterium glomerans (strain ATCC 49209 / DSM 20642 / JCM 10262 / PW2) TaxID=700015 RepID=F2NBN5_CORGP|nr:hypothetical protein [Coriobacterium glomerans]AEB06844.1 hypothetical protein Corgl_0730 [Coriobacterium glomerans PW2]